MPLTVAVAVLAAALLHAVWNALLRFQGDRLTMVTLLVAFSGLFALPGALWTGPPEPAAWPWLAASMALHVGYNVFLARAYGHGELGRVYPLARGAAPLLTLVAGGLLLGQTLETWPRLGVITLAGGILLLALEGGWRGFRQNPRSVTYSLTTALFIAGYTLADGIGARTASNTHAYVLWLFVLNGLPLLLHRLATGRSRPDALVANWRAAAIGGLLSLGAYWIAIWAMTVAPIAAVAALRESSVVFAVLIGALFLREPFTRIRVLSVLTVLAGLVMLRL